MPLDLNLNSLLFFNVKNVNFIRHLDDFMLQCSLLAVKFVNLIRYKVKFIRHKVKYIFTMFENKTKQQINFMWLALIMLFAGDVFYFGALLFRKFMINFMMIFSSEFVASDLSAAGENILLTLTALLGTLLYLVGGLLYAMSKEEAEEKRKFALYATLLWFVTDSIASVVFGFYLNVGFNLVFLAITLIFLHFRK